MYQFILRMWVENRNGINESMVQSFVSKGYITQAEADTILATPQEG